jgi:membrane protein implicated in regulation of membrane protease activity
MLLTASIAGLFLLPPPWNALLLAFALVAEAGEIYLWKRYLDRRRVQTGAEGLVGERGVAVGPLDPGGQVRLRGEIWRARSVAAPAEPGDEVEILAVDGLTLEVEPEAGHSAEPR